MTLPKFPQSQPLGAMGAAPSRIGAATGGAGAESQPSCDTATAFKHTYKQENASVSAERLVKTFFPQLFNSKKT